MGTRMSLAEFYKYARQNRKNMADIYREIEEIQYQFNDLYTKQAGERQALIAAHAPSLLEAACQQAQQRSIVEIVFLLQRLHDERSS